LGLITPFTIIVMTSSRQRLQGIGARAEGTAAEDEDDEEEASGSAGARAGVAGAVAEGARLDDEELVVVGSIVAATRVLPGVTK
jgi:hypothetical protein